MLKMDEKKINMFELNLHHLKAYIKTQYYINKQPLKSCSYL